MEVVGMMRGSGTQHRVEVPARVAPNLAQELAFGTAFPPTLPHRDLAPALEREGRNIDGIAEAVLAHARAPFVVARPASVGRGNIDACDPLSEALLACRLNRVEDPIFERRDDAAVDDGRPAEAHAGDRSETPSVADATAVALVDIRDLDRLGDLPRVDKALGVRLDQPIGREVRSRRSASG